MLALAVSVHCTAVCVHSSVASLADPQSGFAAL
jgi:hypothetical protein